MFEFLLMLLIGAAIGFLAPRAGLLMGPGAILLGVIPMVLLFLVPSASRAQVEEHYGMLATIAFLMLTPAGILTTVISVAVLKR